MDTIRTEYHFARPELAQYEVWFDSPHCGPDGAKFAVSHELEKFYVKAEISFKDRTRTPTHEVAMLAWFEVDLETWLYMRDLDEGASTQITGLRRSRWPPRQRTSRPARKPRRRVPDRHGPRHSWRRGARLVAER